MIVQSADSLDQLALNIERETGFRNIRIAKRHGKAGYVIYTRYMDREGEWQSNFIGSINAGKVYIDKVNRLPVCTVDESILPVEKQQTAGASGASQNQGDSQAEPEPFDNPDQ